MTSRINCVGPWTADRRHIAKKVKTTTDTSLPIIQKILDPNYNLFFKIFWIAAIITCFGLCFYQIGFRIQNYLQEPTTIKLEMKRLTSVTFPSIVLCTSGLTNAMKINYEEFKACNYSKSTCGSLYGRMTTPFEQRDTTMEDEIKLLSGLNHTGIKFSTHCPLFSQESEICDGVAVETEMRIQNMDTIWGYCLVLTLKKEMEYRGPFTWILLSWDNTMFSWSPLQNAEASNDYYFFLQTNESALSRHDAIYLTETLELGYETTVRITAREFHFINSKKRRCTDDLSAIKCFDSCVDNLLTNNISCRIPILKSGNLPSCPTIRKTIDAFANSDLVYTALKSSSCSCTRRCMKIVYKMSIDGKVEASNNHTKLKLLYSDDTLEVLTEAEIFSFSELVSEIGGTVGLYLGICFFTVFELIEKLATKFIHKCC